MKEIKDLTDNEAIEILNFVFPKEKDITFIEISFESKKTEDGRRYITLGGNSTVGIFYKGFQDTFVLPFDNTKVILWLYRKGYNIERLLESNSHYSELDEDYQGILMSLYSFIKKKDELDENNQPLYSFEYLFDILKKDYEKHFYKDYF